MTNFPNGVASFGQPVFPSAAPVVNAGSVAGNVGPSNVYFVSSVFGADGNGGRKMGSGGPLATLKAALALALAGDTIVLLPGHTETLTAAAAVNVNVSNVLIVGLGTGRVKPQYNYTTSAAASFDVTKDNVTLYNITFNPVGVASVTAAVNVKTAANDCTFMNCEFQLSNASNGAALGILTDALAHRLRVLDCKFLGGATATGAAIRLVGAATALDGVEIRRCFFSGFYGAAIGAIEQLTASITNVLVDSNTIINQTAGSTKAAVFTSTSTGMISRNICGILSGAAPFTAAAGWWAGNWSAAAVATNGTLV